MEGRSSNQQVFQGDGDTFHRLLALDLTGELRNPQRQRMYQQVMEDALDEDAPPIAVGIAPGAVDTVRQLYGSDGGKSNVRRAVRRPQTAQDVFDSFATPFTFDQDTGINNQAQEVSPIPTCREAYGYG